jgi:hypothetical protein
MGFLSNQVLAHKSCSLAYGVSPCFQNFSNIWGLPTCNLSSCKELFSSCDPCISFLFQCNQVSYQHFVLLASCSLYLDGAAFFVSASEGRETMEQCTSHLVPHFEGYPAVVKENCQFMFWSLVETGKICSFLGAFMFCVLGSSCSLG